MIDIFFYDRLQGIVASMSRIPTFRRRFRNLVKMLYIEAIQAKISADHIGGIIKSSYGSIDSIKSGGDIKDRDETVDVSRQKKHEVADLV